MVTPIDRWEKKVWSIICNQSYLPYGENFVKIGSVVPEIIGLQGII